MIKYLLRKYNSEENKHYIGGFLDQHFRENKNKIRITVT